MTTGSVNYSNEPHTTFTKVWSGDDDPLKRKINAYSMDLTQGIFPGGYIYNKAAPWWGKKYIRRPSAGFGSRGLPYGDVSTILRTKLGNKVAAKIREHEFDLGVMLAEARPSFQMIGNSARKIAAILLAIKHRDCRYLPPNMRKACQSKIWTDWTKDASELWLELEFGWRPLLMDAYDAGEAAAVILQPQKRGRITTSAKVSTLVQPVGSLEGGNPYAESLPPGCTWGYYPNVCIESGRLQFDLVEQCEWSKSLGLDNPALIAWELIPYSFVIDWFLKVGDWLQRRAYSSTVITNGQYTNRVRTKFRGRLEFSENCEYFGDVHFDYVRVQFSRLPISSLATWTDVKPTDRYDWWNAFRGDAGIRHLLDSLALLKNYDSHYGAH